jgi:hypothetical protein
VEGTLEAQAEVALGNRHEVLVEFTLATIGRGLIDCELAVRM